MKEKKIKILAVSDLHNDFRGAKKLAEKAEKENVDAVIICGDITFFDDYMSGMIGPFMKTKKKVFFIPGNHDSEATSEFISEKYKIRNLHGSYVSLDDLGIFGCGGANVGPNIVTEKEIEKYLKRGFVGIKGKERKLMITHVHPADGKVEKKFKFEGSDSVKKAIYEFKPDVHIHGHIHEAEGMEEYFGSTRSFCVGKKGKIIYV